MAILKIVGVVGRAIAILGVLAIFTGRTHASEEIEKDAAASVINTDNTADFREAKSIFNLNFGSKKVSKRRCLSNQEEGVCYKRSDCTRYGGTPGESCGSGSVCCILKSMCLANNTGEFVDVKRNLTHLVEPTNYNSPQQCRFNIPKQKDVCQLRLDFKKFSLANPVDGDCMGDVMIITGAGNLNTMKICGEAQNQHLYLDYGTSDTITVSLNLLSTDNSRATYDILVTMIRCDSTEKAPSGCTQYYTQTSDEIRSFNFNGGAQLNEQRYTACVQSFSGSGKIKWERCASGDFLISGTNDSSQTTGSECSTDFVEILGAGKFCGTGFPPSVYSEAKPFVIFVNFDEQEILQPNTPWNATVGCYEGWTCYDDQFMPVPESKWPCSSSSKYQCVPPTWFSELVDLNNTGFCLRYTIS